MIYLIIKWSWFYDVQTCSIPNEDREIKEMFSDFGTINDQIYKIAKKIIKSKKWSIDELKKAETAAKRMNEHNVDFRIYEMRHAIQHAIWCIKHDMEKTAEKHNRLIFRRGK